MPTSSSRQSEGRVKCDFMTADIIDNDHRCVELAYLISGHRFIDNRVRSEMQKTEVARYYGERNVRLLSYFESPEYR